MKLGEALTLRARQARKLNDLKDRIVKSSIAQEGDSPAEDVAALTEEYTTLSLSQAQLIQDITAANLRAGLTADILLREHLRRMVFVHRSAIIGADPSGHFRYGREEIKWVPQIDVAATQAVIEDLEREANALDVRLQEANWSVDL